LLRTRGTALGLVGALGGYLLLFGPLVLVPAVLTARGESLSLAGLVLTALPAGFAFAALAADRILPRGWSDRRRALAGATLALGSLLALLLVAGSGGMSAAGTAGLAVLLALLGLGLGVFAPANNALIMAAIPRSAAGTGGGLVNMARALGTALGVALVTLSLHQAPHSSAHENPHGIADSGRIATTLLALVAAAVVAVTGVSRSASASTSPSTSHQRQRRIK
jgi:MFS family permease